MRGGEQLNKNFKVRNHKGAWVHKNAHAPFLLVKREFSNGLDIGGGDVFSCYITGQLGSLVLLDNLLDNFLGACLI